MQNPITATDILHLKDGDENTFKKVYDVHCEQVYQVAFHFLKNTAWCEEIVQDAFLKLWLHRHTLNETGNIGIYLYIITKRLCLNRLREIRRSGRLFNKLMDNIVQSYQGTEDALLAEDMNRHTQQIIDSLPKQQRVIFNMSRTQGLSHKEIAEQLGLSPNTVKNHMVQALKTLKTALHQYGYPSLIVGIAYQHLILGLQG